ncbi:hypothetical protein ACOSP7_004386 [Xanthoceras sorbifolium]
MIQVDTTEIVPSFSGWTLGYIMREYIGRVSILYEDFLTRGLSQCIEVDLGMDLCHTLLRHAFVTLKRDMKLEMNESAAKYKEKINELKDKIERAKSDLHHSYELLEKQKGDLAKKDEELAQKGKSLEEEKEAIHYNVQSDLFYNIWLQYLPSTSASLA